MKKSLVLSVAGITTLCTLTAFAADQVFVMRFLEKSDFRGEVQKQVRANGRSLPPAQLEKFISLIDFKYIENTYAQAMVSGMSNEDMKALIAAYEIPGCRTAVQKQVAVSGALIGAIFKEVKKAATFLEEKQ